MASYRTPGVYREELVVRDVAGLVTGVPAFVGFADALPGAVPPAAPVALSRFEDFAASFARQAGSYLDAALAGFFANGGTLCYVQRANATASDPLTTRLAKLTEAIAALETLDSIDLVAVPDAMALLGPARLPDPASVQSVQQALLGHCGRLGDRFALIDPLPGLDGPAVQRQRAALTLGVAEPVDGALYYPWLLTEGGAWVPPCGHVAGIYARSDARTGVFKSPANEPLYDVVDLETPIDDARQAELNPDGINCLRAFPGRGLRVWGARTLSRDPAWLYVSVRRLVLTLSRWITLNLPWAGFEPNTPLLWMRITRALTRYLTALWQAGALAGNSPELAFRVQCDELTNPPEARDAGQCVTELALAPTLPAEFVRVRVVHRAGSTELIPAAGAAA